MKSTNEIIAKINEISNIYKTYSSIPNLFDIARLNENAHTRVIHMLLNYRREKVPIFLKSFLGKLSDNFENLSKEELVNSKIEQQRDYIDCLIQVGEYCIVIENKIHGARDQDQQLDNYIAKAGKNRKLVYAAYLTLTGGEPSESSISEITKNELADRIVSINYLTHILEWLQNDVLPECTVRESLLENSLRIYIDHLNGILGQKHNELKLVKDLKKIFGLEISKDCYQLLQKTLSESQLNMGSDETFLENYENFSSAIQVLLREIEKEIPYVNENNVAYVLKDMFKNCPPWKERSIWVDNCANIDPFFPSYFMDGGCRYLRLSNSEIEIHLRCSIDGIKNGPYILLDLDRAEERFGKDNLESIGLVRSTYRTYRYIYPFSTFDEKKTTLVDVALHIKRLVDGLKKLPTWQSSGDHLPL